MANMQRVKMDVDVPVWTGFDSVGDVAACALGVQRPGEEPEVATLKLDLKAYTSRGIFKLAQEGRLYEHYTSTLVLGCLRPGDIALDIGAHVGFFATLFRLAVGPTGRVFAFEPVPETYRNLLFNVLSNGFTNVLPLPLAVAELPGLAMIHVNSRNDGESSLLNSRETSNSYPVQVAALDQLFLETLQKPARLIKIDVEGVEMLVLQGGSQWFDRHPPEVVICELNRGALINAGSSEEALREFFTARGYRCALVNNGSGADMLGARYYRFLSPGEPSIALDNPYVYNLMFVHGKSDLYPAPTW